MPRMAALLGVSFAVCYERQKALIRAGILPLLPGRGPGSGVRLTPEAIAALLVAVMGTDTLAAAASATAELLASRSRDWPIDGGHTLKDALVAMITRPDLARQIDEIEISRGSRLVIIRGNYSAAADFDAEHTGDVSHFVPADALDSFFGEHEPTYEHDDASSGGGIEITATLRRGSLQRFLASAREVLALADA